jgi:hypothetical protein
MDAAFLWLMGFIASQMLIIGLGSLPLRYWMSFRQATATPKGGPSSASPAPSKPAPAGA